MSSKEIYVSTDVEADGPIPGPNSMLSFGSAAYTGRKELISTFSANLETLPGATADPKTAEWWAQQPEAWAACRQELEMPETAMRRYVLWLKALPGKPVFVGYPAGFDFLFVYWYLIRFAGESPFGWAKDQCEAIGVAWPPVQGWRRTAVGRQISDEARAQFELGLRAKQIRVEASLDLFN